MRYLLSSVYTGYLDVDYGAKHMFFYFFESRRDPANGSHHIYYKFELKVLDDITINRRRDDVDQRR